MIKIMMMMTMTTKIRWDPLVRQQVEWSLLSS